MAHLDRPYGDWPQAVTSIPGELGTAAVGEQALPAVEPPHLRGGGPRRLQVVRGIRSRRGSGAGHAASPVQGGHVRGFGSTSRLASQSHLRRPLPAAPSAADAMHLPEHGRIGVGLPADFVIFCGRRYSELLSRPQYDRVSLALGWPGARTAAAAARVQRCQQGDRQQGGWPGRQAAGGSGLVLCCSLRPSPLPSRRLWCATASRWTARHPATRSLTTCQLPSRQVRTDPSLLVRAGWAGWLP